MAIVQAKKGSNFLPLTFDTSVIAGYQAMTQGLWRVSGDSFAGKVSVCSIQNSSSDAVTTDDEISVHFDKMGSKGITLMTTTGSTNAYANLAAFGAQNFSAYLDNFNSSGKYLLKSITNSRISDIVLVPYIRATNYPAATLAGESTSTGGTQTYEWDTYVSSGYISRPHVTGISFAVYCRTSATENGFGVTRDKTNRVRIASTSAGGDTINVNGQNVNLVPAAATVQSTIPNVYLMNSNQPYEDAFTESALWVTGANTLWQWSLLGNFSDPMRVTVGSALRTNSEYGSNTNPSFGSNYRWYPANLNSPLVTGALYKGKVSGANTYAGAIFYIDCTSGVAPLRTLINMLGFMWVGTASKAVSTIPGDADAHVPVFSAGMPTGEDTIGEVESEPSPIDVDDIQDDPTPEPTPEPEPEPELPPTELGPGGGSGGVTTVIPEPDQINDISNGNISSVSRVATNTKFVCTAATVQNLVRYISATYQPTDEDLVKDFKGSNPIDYIVSCKLFPFAPATGSAQVIGLGGISTGVSSAIFADNSVILLDMGSQVVQPKYNSWLDYKPYTSVKLYVPYCGEMDLDPAIWMGKTCRVLIAVDIETGACTAMVFRGNTIFGTMEGVMGFDIQLFGARQGDYQNQIYAAQFQAQQAKRAETQATLNAVGNIVGLAKGGSDMISASEGGGASGGGSGAYSAASQALGMVPNILSGMVSVESARERAKYSEWQVNHIAPSYTSTGTQDPLTNVSLSPYCRLIYTRAQMVGNIDADMYRRTVGYACMRTGTVKSFDNLIVCGGVVKTTGNLMAAEIERIKAKLSQGVYVSAP